VELMIEMNGVYRLFWECCSGMRHTGLCFVLEDMVPKPNVTESLSPGAIDMQLIGSIE
jgi:hypothetical protein